MHVNPMNRPARLLVTTWDGAGNLAPILALVDSLVRRGHVVDVLAHDVQRQRVEAAGGSFVRFDSAAQIDHSRPLPAVNAAATSTAGGSSPPA